jgi:uncharacterized protein (TIGR02270 family)
MRRGDAALTRSDAGHSPPAVIPRIVARHLTEAGLAWDRRRRVVRAPNWDLNDLAELDDRIAAYLDGLRIVGGARAAAAAQDAESPPGGIIFALGVLAVEVADVGRVRQLLELSEAEPEVCQGLASSLAYVEPHLLKGLVRDLLGAQSGVHRGLALSACLAHGVHPGSCLAPLLEDRDARVRVQASRVCGTLVLSEYLPALARAMDEENSELRYEAAWAAWRCGDRQKSLAVLIAIAEAPGPKRLDAAYTVTSTVSPATANEVLRALAKVPGSDRLVIEAIAAAGNVRYAAWLIDQMQRPPLARLAGETFSVMTGMDLKSGDLTCSRPTDFQSGPSDDPADEDVAPDPDDGLPWPDAKKVARWWTEHARDFTVDAQYWHGAPLSQRGCVTVLRAGTQRRRYAAAQLLTLINPNAPLFDTTDLARRQRSRLSELQ